MKDNFHTPHSSDATTNCMIFEQCNCWVYQTRSSVGWCVKRVKTPDNLCDFCVQIWTYVDRDGAVGIATRYGQEDPGIESGWRLDFRVRPDRSWGPPSLLYNGYRVSFSEVKRTGRGVHHPPTSSAEVKERVEQYLDSRSEFSWPVSGWSLPLKY